MSAESWLRFPSFFKSPAARITLAIFLGTVGGNIFAWTGIPLAWFLGAMATTMIAAFSGLRIEIPRIFRNAMIAVLGVMIGSAFTAEVVANMVDWWRSLIFLILFIIVLTVFIYLYFKNICGFDSTTAYFSSMPGGLTEMAVIGGANGADIRTISLVHITRVITAVTIMPLYFRFITGDTINTQISNIDSTIPLSGQDGLILVSCGLGGAIVGKLLRLPAYALVGPMAISIAVHYFDFSHSTPPTLVIAAAQVIIGASIGCRFSGFALASIRQTLFAGFGAGLMMTGAALIAAWSVSQFVGVSSSALMLALAPGGVAEMGLIALSLGVSTAYVSSMHIIRIGMIVLAAPLFFHLMMRRQTDT